ncbi:catechol 2,3-dioxygenase-like lactoylglutathione lyase family enzyme [Altererythrobacter atlanticus]|uniref:Biphenyl-2,3-diol 1,2-dioxygenase n=1 Tax=Croceibacterium atlanticum TaxID=1267766 RepID=A0A0F7KP97_9SPHN|nr:VOC family protein [Croceibacterium atlanticum]AKH41379.1 Biphenyl-2,3-diol 1,2-dioxygenase [Croceibacterium atlanticum]MBB5732840.1 catechol 2,3-dioxygenase-like lactoylglutathione lyase family enzyme [Croceibacterium atlanticum]
MSRVTEIRYVGYGVTDFDTERKFYADDWGLVEVEATDDLAWFKTHGHDEHHVVRLHRSEQNCIEVIALAADTRADVDDLHGRVSAAGCQAIHPPRSLDAPGGGYGFRFFSPDGLPFEVSADVEKLPMRAMERWEGMPVRISHIVLHSPDHHAAVKFFCDVLGFRVSDWLGDFMCFLRCNSAHHRIAFLPGPACLNHVAYDVLTVDDMMRGISRLRKRGTDIRWGPGRHTAGNNTFSYFCTPAGFAVEYTSELEEVDFETHQDKVHEPGPTVMDQWGIGTGGPQTMPKAEADPCLFRPAEI